MTCLEYIMQAGSSDSFGCRCYVNRTRAKNISDIAIDCTTQVRVAERQRDK